MYILVEKNYLKTTEGLYLLFMNTLRKRRGNKLNPNRDEDKALYETLIEFESNKDFTDKRVENLTLISKDYVDQMKEILKGDTYTGKKKMVIGALFDLQRYKFKHNRCD